MKIACLQPEIPHYRTEFFEILRNKVEKFDLFTYNDISRSKESGFKIGLRSSYVKNLKKGGLLIYSPFKLISKRYDTLVLMLHQGHITTWILLLTKWLHKKKIIVWGQGISVKRYIHEANKPNILLKWQISLADGAWIYMKPEADMWLARFPSKPIIALNNSISGISKMLDYEPDDSVTKIRGKYNIKENFIFIFCARFGSPFRRVDIMLDLISRLDKKKYGFIIIGAGNGKPDFSKFSNVHDFGAVYDDNVKKELFKASDLYFQPGWIGLSVIEAMSYGLPVCTFKRKGNEIRHGVEYGILENKKNALIFDSIDEAVYTIEHISHKELHCLGVNAKEYVKNNHTPSFMADNALKVLNQLYNLNEKND